MDIEEKNCTQCKILQSINQFYKKKNGYYAHCKNCHNKYTKNQYQQFKILSEEEKIYPDIQFQICTKCHRIKTAKGNGNWKVNWE